MGFRISLSAVRRCRSSASRSDDRAGWLHGYSPWAGFYRSGIFHR